ncbi:hypothetical protein [Methylobacterium gnaphalii]|uniref:Uncharacterized protein n=1 Tax=Methylobacterium gnaphalii TaxID=1010610 RepID=A0A512JIZ1_9HYPH|nr:hypothetical protein [Methylobacterium gnaphalii]GEP09919.1 hypothetical protein MGN01_17640 [Methylobacterium gnaphalii]GJD68305.1 hypothetical protein MMMDOFMJ_1224 [Methylobacterium gnaphalii]GLS49948.1 hypothetical protein GCM10007885_28000 [Methylobacterium gnaphalii]
MNASNILLRGTGDGAVEPARDHSVLILVILMLTLVFAPVIGFHVAMQDTPAQATAPSANVVVAAPSRAEEPG